jgi:hypothetical protein
MHALPCGFDVPTEVPGIFFSSLKCARFKMKRGNPHFQ